MAKKAEEAAEKNEMDTLYKITNIIWKEAQEECSCQNERWKAANSRRWICIKSEGDGKNTLMKY